MNLDPAVIRQVVEQTEVIRPPRQVLATFGTTIVKYYLVTEPSYSDLIGTTDEAVVRAGTVSADRPQIVTPYYLSNLFRGFEHGEDFVEFVRRAYGPNAPGLLYTYQNELLDTSIVSNRSSIVAGELADRLDNDGESLAAVIRGVDHLWDISLMKFIHDLTSASASRQMQDLHQAGMLDNDSGLPRAARARIEEMFSAVRRGHLDPSELKRELDRWGLFEEYQDRFLGLFRRR